MNKMDNQRLCIGIDLGTTNTSVATSRVDSNGITILEDNEILQVGSDRRRDMLPSILYVKDGREYIGNRALDLKKNYTAAANSAPSYLENTKRYIGTKRRFSVAGKSYTAIDVAEKILRTVKADPRIQRTVDNAYTCITVPANFGSDQVDNTKEAAIRAGFKPENVILYSEPKAAILSFLHEEQGKLEDKKLDVTEPKRILVVDIGGGTCDVCVIDVNKKADGGYGLQQITTSRDDLGGLDFDKKIAIYLAEKYGLAASGTELTDAEFAQLIDIGQTCKESMSGKIETLVYMDYDGDEDQLLNMPDWRKKLENAESVTVPRMFSGRDIDFELTVPEICLAIESLICDSGQKAGNKDERERFKSMQALIDNTLQEYGISIDSVDKIFLTGGMSRCFPLKAALRELYQKDIICPDKPFLAVSRGAALVNKYNIKEIDSDNKMPRSVMIETDSGHLQTLIAAGESVPVQRTVERTFRTTSRNAVIIRLFEGKDEYDNQLRKLNNVYSIEFDKVFPLDREFRIQYSIDRSKQISFTIRFLDDGSEHHITARVAAAQEENV